LAVLNWKGKVKFYILVYTRAHVWLYGQNIDASLFHIRFVLLAMASCGQVYIVVRVFTFGFFLQ